MTAIPVVAVRVAEGRSESTLLMQLLASAPEIVFDRRYPAEYRWFSYFARLAERATEPFDPTRHPGVTETFFLAEGRLGPVPFESDVVEPTALRAPLLGAMWSAFGAGLPDSARYYAEKIAVPIDAPLAAGIDIRVVDLVRDPRDMLASIRAFTATGIDGFGRHDGIDEREYLGSFVELLQRQYRVMRETPSSVPRLVVAYDELVLGTERVAKRLSDWLGVAVHAAEIVEPPGHVTASSPAASIGRWRTDLDPAEADTVWSELGEAYEALLGATAPD